MFGLTFAGNCGFRTVFWGQRWLHGSVDDQYYNETNQIDVNVCFSEKNGIQKPCLSLKSGFFSIRFLVCEFNHHRQKWFQTFVWALIRPCNLRDLNVVTTSFLRLT